jgi:hypothetical protein
MREAILSKFVAGAIELFLLCEQVDGQELIEMSMYVIKGATNWIGAN